MKTSAPTELKCETTDHVALLHLMLRDLGDEGERVARQLCEYYCSEHSRASQFRAHYHELVGEYRPWLKLVNDTDDERG